MYVYVYVYLYMYIHTFYLLNVLKSLYAAQFAAELGDNLSNRKLS